MPMRRREPHSAHMMDAIRRLEAQRGATGSAVVHIEVIRGKSNSGARGSTCLTWVNMPRGEQR
jgi:hypothetical protein